MASVEQLSGIFKSTAAEVETEMARDLKVFITGAGGFVGRNLLEELARSGSFDIIALTRQKAPEAERSGLRWVSGDIRTSFDLTESLRDCDAIVHLASRVHVMQDRTADPLREYREVNVQGSLRLAEQAFLAGVRRFIFISSIKVNGEKTVERPFSENTPPAPEDAYGISKWEAEQALNAFASSHPGFELVILRPPLVYGPGVGANFLSLIRLVKKVPVLPFGSIHNRRSLIFVGNLVAAIRTVLHSRVVGTFAIADDSAISTSKLCRLLAASMNRKSVHVQFPVYLLRLLAVLVGARSKVDRLVESLEVDPSGFQAAFDYRNPFTVDTGIERTIAAGDSRSAHRI